MVEDALMAEPPKASEREPTTFRPRIRRGHVAYAPNPDEIQIQTGAITGPSHNIRDDESTGVLARFLNLLDGKRTEAEILEDLDPSEREQFQEFVEYLIENKILEYPTAFGGDAPVEDLEPWQDLIANLSLLTRDEIGTFNSLRKASVFLLGAGRIGTAIAQGLGRLGVGTVHVWDPAPLSPEEARTELAYGAGAKGETRGAALVNRLVEAFPRTTFNRLDASLDDLGDHLEGASLVLAVSDDLSPALFETVNAAAIRHKFKWAMAYTDGYDAHVGPFIIPFETACYTCLQYRLRGNLNDVAQYERYVEYISSRNGGRRFPTLVGAPELIAGYVLHEIPQMIHEGANSLAGRALVVDLQEMTMEVESVFRLPRCPSCGKLAQGHPMRRAHASASNKLALIKAVKELNEPPKEL